MDQDPTSAPMPTPTPMTISISTFSPVISSSYLVERTNTLHSNRNGGSLSDSSEKCPESTSIIQSVDTVVFNSQPAELLPSISITPLQPAENHVPSNENEIAPYTDTNLSHLPLPFKLRRKRQQQQATPTKQDSEITVPSLVPVRDITPNQVIWAPVGPSGWVNLGKTNPSRVPYSKAALGVPSSEIQSLASLEPLPFELTPASGITTDTSPSIPVSPVQVDSSSTPSLPGVCILRRSTALIRAHTPDPSINAAAATLDQAQIVYDQNDIAEMKDGLSCIPVKLRRTQEELVKRLELQVLSRCRVSRSRKAVRPATASRSSLRIKAMKGASASAAR